MDEVEQNIVICQLRADWRDTDKSRYFAIIDFNNRFIIRSLSLSSSFNLFLETQGSVQPFSLENVVSITHGQNNICSKTRLDSTAHEQSIICRQFFAGHVVGCWPMEGKKKLHRMIIVNYRDYLVNKPLQAAGMSADNVRG